MDIDGMAAVVMTTLATTPPAMRLDRLGGPDVLDDLD